MKQQTVLNLLAGVAILFAGVALAEEVLLLDSVLASSRQHYPKIQAARAGVDSSRGELLQARGAFDASVDQRTDWWGEGFYDGFSVDSKVVKPIDDTNVRVYGGYRFGDDDFPIYQQELVTNDAGEFNIGVVFSLWRDREIDARRFGLRDAEFGVQKASTALILETVATQREAAIAYWNWLASGLRVKVYRDLVKLAETRQSAIKRRVEAGDLAELNITENLQNLLRRQTVLTNAERDFVLAATNLSLFFRDADGAPLIPDEAQLPDVFPLLPAEDTPALAAALEAISARPELALLDNQFELEQQRLRLADNARKPRVDLDLKAAHDQGGGSRTRRGFEAYVGVNVSIPLETRLGDGMAAKARANMEQLSYERQLLLQQAQTQIRNLINRIEAAQRFAELTANEMRQAERMGDAERRRFDVGASDFFLVNLREERTADARVRHVSAERDYFSRLTDYHAAVLDFSALGVARQTLNNAEP